MKTRFATLFALTVAISSAYGQLHLDTGESYGQSYISNLIGPTRVATQPDEPNWLYVTLSPESISSANVLRVEAGSYIEEFSTDAPRFRVNSRTFGAPSYGFYGAFQITALAGSVTLTEISATIYDASSRTGYLVDMYSVRYVPVPEPATWIFICVASLAAMAWRRMVAWNLGQKSKG